MIKQSTIMLKQEINIASIVKRKKVRYLILFEAITFILASLFHKGFIVNGYGHYAAGIAESVIAGVLVTGLILSWLRPAWTRTLSLLAQGFAIFGTYVGIATIIIGIGPAHCA